MRHITLFVLVAILLNAAIRCSGQKQFGESPASPSTGNEKNCVSGAFAGSDEHAAFNAAMKGILEEHAGYELAMYQKHLYGYMNFHGLRPLLNPMVATANDISNYVDRVDPAAAPAGILVYWRSGYKVLCAGLILSGRRMIVQASPASDSEKLTELLNFERAIDARNATPRPSHPSPSATKPSIIAQVPIFRKPSVIDSLQPATRPPMDLQTLSRALLPPKIASAIETHSVKTLLVVPVGAIGAAPFPALPLSEGHQLIDFTDVVIAPGFYILRAPAKETAFDSSSPMLIVGDPFLANDTKWNFPPLPGARLEAQQVGQLFGKQSLVGTAASKVKVISTLQTRPGPQLIYFATHAIADPVNPQDGSFLALNGGKLYTREIGKLNLKERPLVILSACQTGLGKIFDGPGIFGMALAWRYAGAGDVVISLWNVPDLPTRDLMLLFARRVQGGEHTVNALSEAMRDLRSRDSETVDWAGFAVFGDLPTRTVR